MFPTELRLFVKRTMLPPLVKKFPFASFAVSVSRVLVPEAIELVPTVTNDCAKEALPGITEIVGRALVMFKPPILAESVVAVPASTPVKVAE